MKGAYGLPHLAHRRQRISSHDPESASRESSQQRLIHAAAIADAHGVCAPGAILLRGDEVVAAGAPSEIGEVSGALLEKHPQSVLMPGLLNAHCHLDLTAIGPIPCDEGFEAWLKQVRIQRATDPEAIQASVQLGIDLALAGGSVGVGDIGGAGSWASGEALGKSALCATVWIEVFGIGLCEPEAIEKINAIHNRAIEGSTDRVRIGVSPHAPYSCGPGVFAAAAKSGLPVATHLAETLAEIAFCKSREGAFRELLEELELYSEEVAELGEHPIDAFADELMKANWTIAHANYPSTPDEAPEMRNRRIKRLAATGATVAYCPRASAFFGHEHHPWREYLRAGVPVALGTDSICCLDTPERISVLDEMRYLARNDGATCAELLPMATHEGARALGIDPARVEFSKGPIAGVFRVPGTGSDPLADAMSRDEAPVWVLPPSVAEMSWQ